MTANAQKLFKVLYRLTLPGGLLVVNAAVMIRIGLLADGQAPLVKFLPLMIFVVGLGLSAFFRRSRLFFANLLLALTHLSLAYVMPHVSPGPAETVFNSITILLPLDLLLLIMLKERGIISPPGRRRLAFIAAQIIAVVVLCRPWGQTFAPLIARSFVPLGFTQWSRLTQPALCAFILAGAFMTLVLVRRYRAVESSLFWTLICAFIAFRFANASHLAGIYLGSGAVALIIALIETSYKMAYLDELTQLPSRRALNEALLKLGDAYSIAMLDVDHFKKFNDSFGHQSGDQALRLVASRLSHIAGGGRAYRYGGEEFALVFPNRPPEEVFVYLDRMRRTIELSTFTVRGTDRRGRRKVFGRKKTTNVTVSIGLAARNGDRLTPAEVMRMADQALYKAKAKGRNCVVTARLSRAAAAVQQSNLRILSVS